MKNVPKEDVWCHQVLAHPLRSPLSDDSDSLSSSLPEQFSIVADVVVIVAHCRHHRLTTIAKSFFFSCLTWLVWTQSGDGIIIGVASFFFGCFFPQVLVFAAKKIWRQMGEGASEIYELSGHHTLHYNGIFDEKGDGKRRMINRVFGNPKQLHLVYCVWLLCSTTTKAMTYKQTYKVATEQISFNLATTSWVGATVQASLM